MSDYLDSVRARPDHHHSGAGQSGERTSQQSTEQHSYDELRRMTEQARIREGIKPYSNGKRIFYGLMWTWWSFAFTIGFLAACSAGSAVPILFFLVITPFLYRYAYRIWTWQARSLWFFWVW
jgi:hypothetical protein